MRPTPGPPSEPLAAARGQPRLRRYAAPDEEACLALWLRSWQAAYPHTDFVARLPWWRRRWRAELAPRAAIVVAESAGALVGFVTVDRASGYLDQIVVAPSHWGAQVGAALLAEARLLSPAGLALDVNTDNARAVAFYRKHGFVVAGRGVNPLSGRPVHRMRWRPATRADAAAGA